METIINEGRLDQEEEDIEIPEKDTLVTFTADFERFMQENKHFTPAKTST